MSLVAQIVAGLIRVALGGVGTWLVQRGIVTDQQWLEVVSGLAIAAISLGWTVYHKVLEHRKLVTALSLPPGTTVAQLQAFIASKQETS